MGIYCAQNWEEIYEPNDTVMAAWREEENEQGDADRWAPPVDEREWMRWADARKQAEKVGSGGRNKKEKTGRAREKKWAKGKMISAQ